MKDDTIKSFQSAFSQFLKEEHLERAYKQKQLIVNWEKVVGKTIASRTVKIFFKDGVLFVKLSSAPLKQEMQNSKKQFLKLISESMGGKEVEDVRIL